MEQNKDENLSDEICDLLIIYLERMAEGFCINDIPEDSESEFHIDFIIYNYFRIFLKYNNGQIDTFILLGENDYLRIETNYKTYNKDNFNLYCQELKEKIALRISNKYLNKIFLEGLKKGGKLNWEKMEILAKILIESINKEFGNRISDVEILNIVEIPSHRQFHLKFIAYNYFVVLASSNNGSICFGISYGKNNSIWLNTVSDWLEGKERDNFIKEFRKELELRIPDKFLKANGWL